MACGLLALLASCDILGSSPCLKGSGGQKKERRDLTTFTSVDMRIPGTVNITSGSQQEVSIETFGNIHPEIKTEVVGSTLVIRAENCLEYFNEEATISITMPALASVDLKGSGDINVDTEALTPALQVNVSGSGRLTFRGTAQKLHVSHSGSGDVFLWGYAKILTSQHSGSGKIKGFTLLADSVNSTLTGSGFQQLWVNSYLEVDISGSGNILYRGTPTTTLSTYTGSGRLINNN